MANVFQTEDEFKAFLKGEPRPPFANVPGGLDTNAAPLTIDALRQAQIRQQGRMTVGAMRQNVMGDVGFIQRNVERTPQGEVIPLDIATSAVPKSIYFPASWNREKSDEFDFYREKYGDSVRMSDTGDIIVRVLDSQSGKPKDVLANPRGIGLEDFMDLTTQVPEVAFGVLAARFGGVAKPGVWNAVKALAQMAVGSQVGGGLKDVAVRGAQGEDIRLGEIAGSRTVLGITDFFAGAGMGIGGKVLSTLISPFGRNVGPLQFDAEKGVQYLRDKYGIDFPLSPGERTGSEFLSRSEAMTRKMPGGVGPLKKLAGEQDAAVERVRQIAVGQSESAIPTDEAIGQRAIGTIGAEAAPLEREVGRARLAVERTGAQEIERGIAGATGVAAPVSRRDVGIALRTRAEQERNLFRAQSQADYAQVYANPLASERVLPADNLAKNAKSIIDDLPSKEVISSEPVGVLDQFGKPILRDEKGKEVFKEFVPDNVLARLRALSELGGQKFKLSDLIQMRHEINDDILRGEAVPGVQTRYLSKIKDALTKSITEGLDSLGDPSIRKAWEVANANYAKGIQRFERAEIAAMFRDPQSPHYIGDSQLVDRLTGPGGTASDFYHSFKEFFGAASPEMAQVRRAVADDVLGRAYNPATETINAKQFLDRLNTLFHDNKEVAQDVFGRRAGEIARTAELLGVNQGSLNADEVVKLANSNSLTMEKLRELMSAEAKRDQAYANDIVKKIATGKIDAEKIKATEFVERFAFKAEPRDIRDLMPKLPEDLQLDIRSSTVQKLFAEATGKKGEFTASGMRKALGDGTQRERLEAVLGADTLEDLRQISAAMAPRERGEAAFSAAGGIGAGQQISGLWSLGLLRYADKAAQNFAASWLLASGVGRKYFGNRALGPTESAILVNSAIASTPFVEALTRQYGEGKASELMASLKASVDRTVRGQATQTNAPPTEAQFRQLLNATP